MALVVAKAMSLLPNVWLAPREGTVSREKCAAFWLGGWENVGDSSDTAVRPLSVSKRVWQLKERSLHNLVKMFTTTSLTAFHVHEAGRCTFDGWRGGNDELNVCWSVTFPDQPRFVLRGQN
jgi:hypothetical protein